MYYEFCQHSYISVFSFSQTTVQRRFINVTQNKYEFPKAFRLAMPLSRRMRNEIVWKKGLKESKSTTGRDKNNVHTTFACVFSVSFAMSMRRVFVVVLRRARKQAKNRKQQTCLYLAASLPLPILNRNLSPLENGSCVLLFRVKFETGLSVFFQHCKHKRRVSLQTGTTSVKNFLTLFKRNKKDLRIWRAILRALACTISLYRTVSGLSSGHVNRMTALTES